MAAWSTPGAQCIGSVPPTGLRSARRAVGKLWKCSTQRGDRCPIGLFGHGVPVERAFVRPVRRMWRHCSAVSGNVRAGPQSQWNGTKAVKSNSAQGEHSEDRIWRVFGRSSGVPPLPSSQDESLEDEMTSPGPVCFRSQIFKLGPVSWGNRVAD